MQLWKRTVAACCALLPAVAAAQTDRPDWKQGIFRGRSVIYSVQHGRKLLEGDILLDHVRELPGNFADTGAPSAGVAYNAYLWPKNPQGVAAIPYIITATAGQLPAAITQFNTTFAGIIQLVPHSSETDYVNFDFDPNNTDGQCDSNIGHIGGEQTVGGSASCTLATILHELGHTVGLYHEQSRPDRNTYISINTANVIKGSEANFTQLSDNLQDLGGFDYASIMEYPPYSFTRNGGPVIETIPSGMPLSNSTGYTAGDIDGIRRLYGATPASVTITSNPPGLSVIVDGSTVATPQTFAWALKSQHTLGVPANAQMLSGTGFVYGRWSDNPAATHTITVAPGRGTQAQPRTAPAVTVYTANFVRLSQYTASAVPAGSGGIATSPAPATYPGLSGQFFTARQAVTLTGTGTGGNGYALLTWGGTSSPWSINPKPDIVRDDGGAYAVTGYFSNQPVTTVATVPEGIGFYVDGTFYEGPQSFAADIFPGWTAGSSHALAGYSPVQPYSINSRSLWQSWSDGGALSHSITVNAAGGLITGTYTPQFVPIAYATPSCSATVTLRPGSPDGFYAQGTKITVQAKAASGWVLTGWQDDLAGRKPKQTLAVNDEELAVANYDTTGTPLAVTELQPPSLSMSAPGGTVRILGRGFTANSIVFVNNAYRAATVKSAGEIDVALTSADLAPGGAFPVGVSNFPSGAPCAAYQARGFFITSP